MSTGLTLVDVHAVLPVVLRDYVTRIASADVAAVNKIMALVCTTAAVIVRTMMIVVASQFVRQIPAIICEIAEF